MKLSQCSVTDASGRASSPEARGSWSVFKSNSTANGYSRITYGVHATRRGREVARTFAYDPQQMVSPFPGAYWTGSSTESSPSTRLIVVLLGFAGVLMGAFVFMLARGVH